MRLALLILALACVPWPIFAAVRSRKKRATMMNRQPNLTSGKQSK